MDKFILNETSYFGKGSRKILIEEIKKRHFSNALVVTDEELFKIGISNKITDMLEAEDIKYNVFHDIKPNPTIQNVMDGVRLCNNIEADVIIAIGGGSSIDTAKGISILVRNQDRSLEDLSGISNTENKGVPIIAIPTTAGTAAEVTINYVITNPKTQTKMVCVDENSIPILAIVDSELMASMPESLAAATGMDAMTHAIEGFISINANTMSEMFSMKAIGLLYDNLEDAIFYDDEDALEKVAYAQYIAGMGFSNVGLGIVHSMAHQLGAIYDTPHGLANALLLPTVMEFNGENCSEKFRRILIESFHVEASEFTKEEVISTLCEKIQELSSKLKINQRLRDVGVKQEDFEMLADKAMIDPCKSSNPREVTKDDFINLYRKAW